MMAKHLIFKTLGTLATRFAIVLVFPPRNKSEGEFRLTRIVDVILFLFLFRVYNLFYTYMLTTYCHNRYINHNKYLLGREIFIQFSAKAYTLLARSALASVSCVSPCNQSQTTLVRARLFWAFGEANRHSFRLPHGMWSTPLPIFSITKILPRVELPSLMMDW